MPKSRKNTPLSCRRRQSALVLTSPSWSGFAYDFRSSIRPRIYGSSDRYCTASRSCPEAGAGTSVSSSRKSDNCGLPFGRAARTIWRAREAVIGMVSAAIRRVHVDLHKFFFCSIRAHACSAICLGAPIPEVLARIRRSLCQASRHIKGLLGGFALASMLQSNGCRLWGQGGGATL